MLTGGALGLREKYDTIISRVQSFGAYHFNINSYAVVSRLFQVILELPVISKPTHLRRKISIWILCHTIVPVTYTCCTQDAKFVAAARKVCPAAKQHLDPFQFNFIIQVPGQTVAMHIDGVNDFAKPASSWTVVNHWLEIRQRYANMYFSTST